jgi:hypothetical protein
MLPVVIVTAADAVHGVGNTRAQHHVVASLLPTCVRGCATFRRVVTYFFFCYLADDITDFVRYTSLLRQTRTRVECAASPTQNAADQCSLS